MPLTYQILGRPTRDNALLAVIDTGQSLHRLLFDCGEGCLNSLPNACKQEIEAVFFSHFHIDHIAGFDTLLRFNWSREKPLRVFGPPGAIELLHHRLQGFTWNLSSDSPGRWIITEVDGDQQRAARFLACEGFAVAHPVESFSGGPLYDGGVFQVHTLALDHGIPSQAYLVRENERQNADLKALAKLGLKPGPWMKDLKDLAADPAALVGDSGRSLGELRDRVLVSTAGDSLAYLTDFHLPTPEAEAVLTEFLKGCQTIVCENNYRDQDAELARKNHHMTSGDVGKLAARVRPERLIVFHLSDRYPAEQRPEQLAEVRKWHEPSFFPPEW